MKKDSDHVIVCINFQECHHAYCQGCIDRLFRTRAKKEYPRPGDKNWPCFVCRGLCKCRRCKQTLKNELFILNSQLREDNEENMEIDETGSRKSKFAGSCKDQKRNNEI